MPGGPCISKFLNNPWFLFVNRVEIAISRKRDSSAGSSTTPCNESSALEKNKRRTVFTGERSTVNNVVRDVSRINEGLPRRESRYLTAVCVAPRAE